MDERPKSSSVPLILLAVLLLLIPLAAVLLLAPMVPCPYCHGVGLLEAPPLKDRWIREADLVPRVCDCCGDRLKIGRFREWRFRAPNPDRPIFVKGTEAGFLATRKFRIHWLAVATLEGVTGTPPVGVSKSTEHVPLLTGALQDEDREIRTEAATTLSRMNRKENLPLLVAESKRPSCDVPEILVSGIQGLARHPDLRRAAVEGLKEICEPSSSAPPDSRFFAAAALLELKEPCNSDYFIEHLKSWSEGSKIACRGVALCDRKDALLILIKEMARRPPEYMGSYAEALSSLTGEKFGNDPTAWYRWFEKNKDRFPPQIE